MDNDNTDNSTRLDGLSEENNEDDNNVIAIVSGVYFHNDLRGL